MQLTKRPKAKLLIDTINALTSDDKNYLPIHDPKPEAQARASGLGQKHIILSLHISGE